MNYQHGGRQVRKSLRTTSKREARLKALAIERELLAGFFQAESRAPLICDVAADNLACKRAEGLPPKTLCKCEFAIGLLNELAEHLGIKRIGQITPAIMDKFRSRRTTELAKRPGRDGQKTAVNDLVTIRQIVNFALRRQLVLSDPLAGCAIKKVKTKPQPYWLQDELARILKAAIRQPHRDVYATLSWTGMRIGELQHLMWPDLDFDNRVIKIQAKTGWKPKTGDARSIPMSNELYELLQPQRCQWVFSFPVDRYSCRFFMQRW